MTVPADVLPAEFTVVTGLSQEDILEELTKHSNRILFGVDSPADGDSVSSPIRAVVIAVAVAGLDEDGSVRPMATGLCNLDGSKLALACHGKLADKLEQIARSLRTSEGMMEQTHQ